jgi:plastocyanin domain-containing protein
VILSVIGATTGAVFLKKFVFIPNLFIYLVILSFIFATLSAVFYLKRNRFLTMSGIKKKWKYLSILFLTTIIVNVGLIYFILPAVANIGKKNIDVSSTAINTNDNYQTIYMDQLGGGYKPNQFTIKKNIPVKWIITSKSQSCAASIYSEKLGISQDLNPGENVIEFTATETGKISFSCYMGMYSGYFNVIP